MKPGFHRVAIVNRGHVALRFIHCAREFNREHGTDIRTIAIATDVDRGALFVREADEVAWIGAPFFVDPRDRQSKSSYLDIPRIREALVASKADAAWLGWGFVPNHLEYAAMCEELGVQLLGPEPSSMRLLRDKLAAKELARTLGIPVVPSSAGPVETLAEAGRFAEASGYPVIVKPAFGGAGGGLALAPSALELEGAFERARAHGRVYLETYRAGARLVSVEILADRHGTVWDVGVRDGSAQRLFAKVIDEAPAPDLAPELERTLRGWAVAVMRAARYEGVGAVEFLVGPQPGEAWFLEVNARLETAHDVLEATTGIDLVKQEIFIARGGKLEGPPPVQHGHAFLVRLLARDPEDGFRPTPGVIDLFRPPMGPGLRVEASGTDGDEIARGLGTHVAKLVAFGRTRSEALARLERGLRDTTVVVRGGTTNKSFLLALVQREELRAGAVDVDWLDRVTASGELVGDGHGGAAIIIAAIESYEAEATEERKTFLVSASRGRPTVRSEVGKRFELLHRGRSYRLSVARRSAERYEIAVGQTKLVVAYEHRGTFERRLTGGAGRGVRAIVTQDSLRYSLDVEGVAHRVHRQEGGMVRAPSPGIVQSVKAKVGSFVERGDTLVVIEAMKTELQIAAPFAGFVREVHAVGNVPVAAGAPLVLVQVDDVSENAAQRPDEALFLVAELASHPVTSSREAVAEAFETLREAMLGYDVDASEIKRALATLPARIAELGALDADVLRHERGFLGVFVDLVSLFRRRQPAWGGADGEDDGAEERLITFLRTRVADEAVASSTSPELLGELRAALAHYGAGDLASPSAIDDALFWIFRSRQRLELLLAPVVQILERWLLLVDAAPEPEVATLLDKLARTARGRYDAISDLALEVSYRFFARPGLVAARRRAAAQALAHLASLAGAPGAPASSERDRHLRALVESPYPLLEAFAERVAGASGTERELMLEALAARNYHTRAIASFAARTHDGVTLLEATMRGDAVGAVRLFAALSSASKLESAALAVLARLSGKEQAVVDLVVVGSVEPGADETRIELSKALSSLGWPASVERITVVAASTSAASTSSFTFRGVAGELQEDGLLRGIHPMLAERLRLSRLAEFTIERLPAAHDIYLFRGVARNNPKDERLFAFAEVDLTAVRNPDGTLAQLPHCERVFYEAVASIRSAQALRPLSQRLHWNRVELDALLPADLDARDLRALSARLSPSAAGAGLEKIVVRGRFREGQVERTLELDLRPTTGMDLVVDVRAPDDAPIALLSEYEQKVVRARQRGLVYPYEVIRMLTTERGSGAELPPGEFTEYDLASGELAPVVRPPGQNTANVVVGLIRSFTPKVPEGMTRVILLGDPSKSLGSLAEPECRRVLGALALARRLRVPVEWFALSSGAKISMDSGTENMDWIAAVLRGLIELTQEGGEVNIVVMGINVGGQPYWNAEATMLLHTRGILVMMPQSAMVLTGKRALDYSGGVSAEDDFGIGGYDRIMGPNGQGQYFARDVADACRVLLRHYEHCYVVPGERFPRRAVTSDVAERDIGPMPHGGELATVADVFSSAKNPGRKKPFHIRKLMAATIDQDHEPLERWRDMRDAENAVVWDAHLGGYPICLLGIESEPLARRGPAPADGPETFTGGTLFPLASKKIARAITAASGVRPVVILANLSGFDGSPESMRRLQLEFGAEIGRSVVNFRGPIVFCVVSRFHGGAYVVFSRTLNENLEVAALEGTFASVIGGAPAAGVVFAGDVDARARKDPRIKALAADLATAPDEERRGKKAQLDDLLRAVRAEKVGELAEEFDREHSVQRALRVGSLHTIIAPQSVRPYLVGAIERGMARELARLVERLPDAPSG